MRSMLQRAAAPHALMQCIGYRGSEANAAIPPLASLTSSSSAPCPAAGAPPHRSGSLVLNLDIQQSQLGCHEPTTRPSTPFPFLGTVLACGGSTPTQRHWWTSIGTSSSPLARSFATEASGNAKPAPKPGARIQLSKAQRRNFQGNIQKYKLMGGRPEFHNVDRNKYGRIFEPWHTFEVVITSSKNNCWVTVKNKGRRYRCVFFSHAGNVGMRKANRKTEMATERIALNVARKLKRLGVVCCEVTFRKIMKVETCLQAFQACGLQVTRLTHVPRLPKGIPMKPRKQRRV